MEVYLARQPIFDAKYNVVGYELLYRDAANIREAQFVDGNRATCRLLSDAITVFGLPNLTNSKPAYVNFTDTLLLNDFVTLADPKEVVVEVLETVQVSDLLIEKLRALKRSGYRLALDDYDGDERFAPLLPIANIVKVDFRLTNKQQQREISEALKKYRSLIPLAEKVENQEEFEWAKKLGFQQFQGYFFAKPTTMGKTTVPMTQSSYVRLLAELNKPGGVDFARCASIIRADAVLTYRIMQQVQKVEYYRGNMISALSQALVMMGVNELRRWTLLVMARDNNRTRSDELVRQAYLRGIFAQKLMTKCKRQENPEEGFILGMFSLLDQILDMDMEELLKDIQLPDAVRQALLGETENFYSNLLAYIAIYESGNRGLLTPEIGISLTEREVSELYMDSVLETDKVFSATEESK